MTKDDQLSSQGSKEATTQLDYYFLSNPIKNLKRFRRYLTEPPKTFTELITKEESVQVKQANKRKV